MCDFLPLRQSLFQDWQKSPSPITINSSFCERCKTFLNADAHLHIRSFQTATESLVPTCFQIFSYLHLNPGYIIASQLCMISAYSILTSWQELPSKIFNSEPAGCWSLIILLQLTVLNVSIQTVLKRPTWTFEVNIIFGLC